MTILNSSSIISTFLKWDLRVWYTLYFKLSNRNNNKIFLFFGSIFIIYLYIISAKESSTQEFVISNGLKANKYSLLINNTLNF